MQQYIVLQNIAPDQGPIIKPAQGDEPPVILSDEDLQLIYDHTPREGITPAERTARLVAIGVLAKAEAKPEEITEAKEKFAAHERRGPRTPYS